MSGRVEGKVAIIVGGGQTPGETIGNGRATALLLAQEGARVFVADRDLQSAEDTADLIRKEGGEASACLVDVVEEEQVEAMVEACIATYGAIDILHNNVGASLALGDALATELSVEAFDRIIAVNLRGMWLASKHALPQMRKQEGGSIINISSMAARSAYPYLGYKTTKVAVVGLTENLAAYHADAGVRANAILPGLMNTPMAIEPRVAAGADRAELTAQRDSQVLLGGKMGTGWDIARASLFLHSDEASFITGISLAVDGGSGLRR
jgi:NAD(P)-dependent dehydrogenase (short-subunit alcohol dehydrogenase family)